MTSSDELKAGEPTADELKAAPQWRVLVVDDDRDWCEAAALALEGDGITVDRVHSGDEAMRALDRRGYDAAIIDVHMPGRWGVDVVRDLRGLHGEAMPILIATAAPAAAGVCAGLLAGADEAFFKSDPDQTLAQTLRRLWRRRAH